MHIRHFLLSSLSLAGLLVVGVAEAFTRLFSSALDRLADLWRVAFPPDPLHLELFDDWRGSLGRAVAPFRAFIERARSHVTFSGSGFHLDTIARVF